MYLLPPPHFYGDFKGKIYNLIIEIMKKTPILNSFPFQEKEATKRAFTLVELIVVITILAILWTIAFISLQWYSRDARDSKRTADLWNIKTSLELFSLKTWKYPIPDSYSTITYSWWTEKVWYQWVVWDQVTINLKSLNEKPLDPLTNDPYVYSTTNSYKEYEVLALYEWSVAYNPIINQTNAATIQLTPKIVWNYNWVFVKTTHYIIPTPSIVIADPLLTWTPISLPLTSSNIQSLVTTNGKNIPKNSLTPSQTWWLNINLAVYTWSITKTSTDTQKVNAMKQIQNAYTWSNLSTNQNISYILNQTSTGQILALTDVTLLKWQTTLTSNTSTNTIPTPPSNSCAITPTFIHIWSPHTWIPTSPNQSWTYNTTPWNCTYTCSSWYTWDGCSTLAKKTVADCWISPWLNQWDVIYWTLDWTDVWLTCSDDIIVCNWTTWSWNTISACNVWASIVYTTMYSYPSSTAARNYSVNTWMWWLYQWWNKTDVSRATVSSARIPTTTSNSTYNNSLFIAAFTDWTLSPNPNLWWDNWWNWTNLQMQWPCPSWYHVPRKSEWSDLFTSMWPTQWTAWSSFIETRKLKMPAAGARSWYNAGMGQQGVQGFYWASTPATNPLSWYMLFTSTSVIPNNNDNRADALSVRCFKN